MPIPEPKPNENKEDYISRCIKFQKDEDADRPEKQMKAICYSKWRKSKAQNYEIEDISKQDIIDMGVSLVKEIIDRKKSGDMKFLVNPEEGTEAYKEFWKAIKKELTEEEIKWITEKEAEINEGKKEVENMKPELDFLEDIEEGKIFENFVMLVGSTAEQDEKGDDIDIMIRDKERDDSDPFRRAIVQRIIKSFPEDVKEDLHIFAESTGPHNDYYPLYDLVLKRKDFSEINKHEFSLSVDLPFTPKKPSEVAQYDKEKLLEEMKRNDYNYFVEKKVAGFHAVATNKNDARVYSEGQEEFKGLSSFNKKLEKISDNNFIVTGELIYKDAGLASRRELMKFLEEGSPDDSNVEMIVWDIVSYDGEDLTDKPLKERQKYLDKLNLSKSDSIRVVPRTKVETKSEAEDTIEEYAEKEYSEGVVVKEPDSKYDYGSGKDWMKFRKTQKFDARVVAKDSVEGSDMWNYEIGIDLSDNDIDLIKEDYIKSVDNNKVHSLGETFNTDIKADKGDILKIRVEEVWRHEYNTNGETKIRYSIHKPSVVDKLEKDSTDGIKRLDNIVSNLGVSVQENSKENEEEPDEEGGTRSEVAKKFWRENWHEMYPEDGEGKYVYQAHWRGLNEDEADNMDHEELIEQGKHSVHGDLRGSVTDDSLWGYTVFEGDAEEIPQDEQSKLIYMSKNKGEDKFEKLQGQFKMEIPGSWLDVGKEEGFVSEPGGVGSTSDSYSKLFALDYGEYKIGVQHQHFFEYFLDGDKMEGRVIITYAPVGGSRKWLIDFTEDQEPEAETTTIDEKVKELRESDTDHKWLIWNNPNTDENPKKIDVEDYEIEEETNSIYDINEVDKLADKLWNEG